MKPDPTYELLPLQPVDSFFSLLEAIGNDHWYRGTNSDAPVQKDSMGHRVAPSRTPSVELDAKMKHLDGDKAYQITSSDEYEEIVWWHKRAAERLRGTTIPAAIRAAE